MYERRSAIIWEKVSEKVSIDDPKGNNFSTALFVTGIRDNK